MSAQPSPIGNFTVKTFDTKASPEELFQNIPDLPPTPSRLSVEGIERNGRYQARLRQSVVMYQQNKFTREQYLNERNLAYHCHHFGDDRLVGLSVEEALDEASETSHDHAKLFFDLAGCLEKRMTYSERVF